MSNDLTTVKVTTTIRDIANNIKAPGETLREFFDRVIRHIEERPELLDETFEPHQQADKSDAILEEIKELRRNVLILREGLKMMVLAASKDNAEIKKVVDHFSKTKSLDQAVS